MDLERMAVRLRPRNAWEALDLGVALARSNALPLYAVWFAVFAPVALAVHAALWSNPFWAWAVLWWMKPLFDRAVLAVLAGSLFGERRGARSLAAAVRSSFATWTLIGALTWRRFDFARSFHLPVYQLERLSGKRARGRVRTLDRDGRGAAVWLSFLFLWIELLLGVAISLGVSLLFAVQSPLEIILESWGRMYFSPAETGGHAGALVAAIAVSAVEPLYVACGFTLYLQRRTVLEGWDIELRFRQLAARFAAVLMAIALCVAAVDVPEVQAAEPKKAAEEIRAVLKSPDFGRQEPVQRLKYVGPEWKSEPSKAKPPDLQWILDLGRYLANAARVLSWIGGVALLAVALYFLARYLRKRGFLDDPRTRPGFLFGLDVRPESLPADVAATAAALVARGSHREALSLLYRGALVRLMDEGIEFAQGDTEGDCLRKVDRAAEGTRRRYFHHLVAAWESLAYGHHAIEAERLLDLAHRWPTHFSAAPVSGPPEPQAA